MLAINLNDDLDTGPEPLAHLYNADLTPQRWDPEGLNIDGGEQHVFGVLSY